MKTISEYRKDIEHLMKQLGDMKARCVAEKREPTEEEISQANKILSRVDELRSVIEMEERLEATQGRIAQPSSDPIRPDPQDPSGAGATGREKRDRFLSFGEQMQAVMTAGMPGGTVDPRLLNTRATGLGESVPSDGGFLVQQDFSSKLLEDVFQTGILASRCQRIPISSNSNGIKIPGVDETSRASTRSGGVVAYWKDEAAAKTASQPKFRTIELNLKKLIGLCYATDELLQDATALEGYIRRAFIAEFGFQIDEAIVNGTGAGQPLGFMNSGCLVTVGKETGQAALTVVAENIVKMYSRLFASSRPDSLWLINQNIEPQLFTMSLAVGTGGIPIYMPAGGLSAQPYGTLFGRPVIAVEQAQTLGTAGDIAFVDLKNGYILAEKGGIQSDMSIHVQFVYDESVFRFVLRVDGQPVRASALTPYKGGANYTQSHFIVLETRS